MRATRKPKPHPKSTSVAIDVAVDLASVTLDAQIAICKLLGLTHAQTASAISTPESPDGIVPSTVLRRLSVSKKWIEPLVEWAFTVRRKYVAEPAEAFKDVAAYNLRAEMEKALPKAWSILFQALQEGNPEMAIYVIEQTIGKANQPHSMHVTGSIQHAWRGREELLGQEQDMLESERMLKMLPAVEGLGADANAQEAELVATE